jgi:hypothetical protein
MKRDAEYKAMCAGWDMCLRSLEETRDALPMRSAMEGVMKGTMDTLIKTLRKRREPSMKALWEARQENKNTPLVKVEIIGRSDP